MSWKNLWLKKAKSIGCSFQRLWEHTSLYVSVNIIIPTSLRTKSSAPLFNFSTTGTIHLRKETHAIALHKGRKILETAPEAKHRWLPITIPFPQHRQPSTTPSGSQKQYSYKRLTLQQYATLRTVTDPHHSEIWKAHPQKHPRYLISDSAPMNRCYLTSINYLRVPKHFIPLVVKVYRQKQLRST